MAFDPRSQLIPSVKYVIPVASGKGGVGKSTVSVNLALALAKLGARVGLMDADVYGPSIPTLMGADARPEQKDNKITPPVSHGIKLISMGFFTPKGDAVIWRGPMLSKMVDQFLGSVDWGELDYLIVDLPPGTGDIQLSLCQRIPLTGAVIVSTPQDLAFEVAEKAIVMFKKLRTPILGLVENMSGFVCSQCNHEEDIFGKGGAQSNSKKHNIPFLGDIPLATKIRETSDSGRPIVIADPESLSAKAFLEIAKKLKSQVEKTELSEATEKPEPKVKGTIRAIGLSNFNVSQLQQCLDVGPVHSMQNPYNLFEKGIERNLLPFCAERNICVLTYGAICRGLLSGKFSVDSEIKAGDIRYGDPKFKKENLKYYTSATQKLKSFAAERDATCTQLAIQWAAKQPGVTCALVGARNPKQAEENAAAFDAKFSKDELKQAESIVDQEILQPIGPEFMAPPITGYKRLN